MKEISEQPKEAWSPKDVDDFIEKMPLDKDETKYDIKIKDIVADTLPFNNDLAEKQSNLKEKKLVSKDIAGIMQKIEKAEGREKEELIRKMSEELGENYEDYIGIIEEIDHKEADFIEKVRNADIPVIVEDDGSKIYTNYDFNTFLKEIGILTSEEIKGNKKKEADVKKKVIKAFEIIKHRLFESGSKNIRINEMKDFGYLSYFIYDLLEKEVKERGIGLDFFIEDSKLADELETQEFHVSEDEKIFFNNIFRQSFIEREKDVLRFDLEKILLNFNIPHDKNFKKDLPGDLEEIKKSLAVIFNTGMIKKLEQEKDNHIIINLEDHKYLRDDIYNLFSEHKKDKLMLVMEDLLGIGGIGEVRKGSVIEKNDRRFIAAKLGRGEISPNIDIVKTIEHTNVSKIELAMPVGNSLLQIMEYVEGNEFNIENLELPDVLESMIQVIEGLGAFHEKGLAHFDIKPANIIVGAEKSQIIDCEMAQKWEDIEERLKKGQVAGSPEYIPPEGFFYHEIFKVRLETEIEELNKVNIDEFIEVYRKREKEAKFEGQFWKVLQLRMDRHIHESMKQLIKEFGASPDNISNILDEYMQGFKMAPEKKENETSQETEKREELEKKQVEKFDIFSLGRMLEKCFIEKGKKGIKKEDILSRKLENVKDNKKKAMIRKEIKALVGKMTSVRPLDRPGGTETIEYLKSIINLI